ncbi:hypothetical protein GPECTOR_2g1156 [Gonium pectorale]|uniref:Protein kinase domain-containing protein n=1 Tax=Gonium pectorale TaxID=33097 RepID=A0A150H0A7_GONPE|nr:hypothetical protein GPECTOR_2g1156 [Gonium pectorale]|eukprot:KXZ55606.1 hypothetical protein GPECTOR_2g1156 [Gonium pectorale]
MEFGAQVAFVDLCVDATIPVHSIKDIKYSTKGGFALVYVANYTTSSGVVPIAVKVLKPENHLKPAAYGKFLQEVALQASLSHQ